MIEALPLLLLLAVALGVAWFVARPPAVFVVQVRDGRARSTHGKVTDAFLAAVRDVCHEFCLTGGEVRGVLRGTRIALQFTPNFSGAARQRLRNWWAMSGWSMKSGRQG